MLVFKILIFFICLLSFGCSKGNKNQSAHSDQPKTAKEERKAKTVAKTLPKVVTRGKPEVAEKGGESPTIVKSTVAPEAPPKIVKSTVAPEAPPKIVKSTAAPEAPPKIVKSTVAPEAPPKVAINDNQVRSNTDRALKTDVAFNLCHFPVSLKKAVEKKLNMNCAAVTPDHLAQIKQLKLEGMTKGESKQLSKEYASYFPVLEGLDVSKNQRMFSLPSFVTHVSGLKKLNVSKTGVSGFSEDICKLKKIEVLIANHNKYEGQEVPREIFCLSTLKVLDMSHSSIRYIDEYIGHLSQLEELYMSGNLLLLIPQMLSTLPHLTLVDFRNNSLKNEDLNILQSCKSLKGEEKKDCQDDLSDSIECEAVHELPFQRGEPLRQMYINLASQSQELMKQCDDDDSKNHCPDFIRKCRDYPEEDKVECMLDDFESTGTQYKYRPHRDKCYEAWAIWLVDYEKFPELLNKTIAGKTIREMRYVSKNQSNWSCWEWPWENVDIMWGIIGSAPEKYDANPFEVFPKQFRTPGIASYVKSWWESGGGTFHTDIFWWVPEDCPHLPLNLKEQIKKIAEKQDQKNEGGSSQ